MQTKIFKKAIFGGFDRADVMQYINQLQTEADAKLRRAQDEAFEASKESERLSEENSKIISEIKQLQKQADELGEQLTKLSEQNKALSDVNAELTDEISHQVGKIFTQARINAQNIVSEAREKAEQIEKSSNIIRDAAQNGLHYSKDAISGAREEVENILNEVIDKLNSVFDGLENPVVFNDGKNISSTTQSEEADAVKKIPVKISKHSPIRRVD